MALKRSPVGIQVNGAAFLVKGDADGLFQHYQRVPGLANFTMPDETGSSNEVQTVDGPIAFAQTAGVGTITGTIAAVSGHPTHDWLAAKKGAEDSVITVTIIRPAVKIDREGVKAGKVAVAAAASGRSTVTLDEADTALREGMIAAAFADGTQVKPLGFVRFDGSAPSGGAGATDADKDNTMAKWQAIVRVNDDDAKFAVTPGATAAIAKSTSGDEVALYLRRAGRLYEGISCTVNGLGDGDFQSGGAVGSTISLQPSVAVTHQTEWRSVDELGAAGYDYAGALVAAGPYNAAFADLS